MNIISILKCENNGATSGRDKTVVGNKWEEDASDNLQGVSGVVGRCRDRSTFIYFFGKQFWDSPSVLHFVKQQSQARSILCCKYNLVWC